MASSSLIPHRQYYSCDHFSSTEFCCNKQTMFNINNGAADVLNYEVNSSLSSFPDQQFADCMVVPQMSDIVLDFSVSDQVFGEDYSCGSTTAGLMVPNFCHTNYNPMPPAHQNQNWELGMQGKVVTKVEEGEVKVGRYSVEERKDRILRYLKKRNHRNFNKTIKYACRKTLADKRIRVRGRFAKNNQPSEEEEEEEQVAAMNTAAPPAYQLNNSFYKDSFQMKYEEDYWLQAAIDNLVHLPYLAS